MSDDKKTSNSAEFKPVELLVGGSFEQANVRANSWTHQKEVGGWKSSSEVEVWGKNFYGIKATEGDKFAELDYAKGVSNIYQDVKTDAGIEYSFSFDTMKRPDSKSGSDTVVVFWNGKEVGRVEPGAGWGKSEFKVIGTGGNDRIEFREAAEDDDSYGGLIDNASLKSTGRVEREVAEKAAAEKAAAEKAAAEKAAAEKAAAEKAAAEKAAAEKAAAEKAAAEKAAAEKAENFGEDIHIGNNSKNGLSGWEDHDSLVFGEGGKDVLSGLGGNDRMAGGGGDDVMSGDAGNDTMFGSSAVGGKVDMTKFKVTEDTVAKVTFNYESAGYKNALGLYKVAADGSISGVQILFANASLKNSGGDLIAGQSSVDVAVKAGEKLSFFVVPDGFSQRGMAALLTDKSATFKFVGADGKPGNINAGGELKLVQTNAAGVDTLVKSAYGTTVFHSIDNGKLGLNGDGLKHASATVNNVDGTVKIGFEDLKWGGDKDYDDSVFTVSLGAVNTSLLAKEATKAVRMSDNDDMTGGTGNDKMFGMSDNDKMDGGAGDDQMWGNSGNDTMSGGEGNDTMSGGQGDDVVLDGAGDDAVLGNSGNDTFVAGEGNDSYDGGSGFDTIDYSRSSQGVKVDLNAHTVAGMGSDAIKGVEAVIGTKFADDLVGDKNDNTLVGGAGDDTFRGRGGADTFTGGEGRDTFVWYKKDVTALDHITDFGKDDRLNLRDLLKGQNVTDALRVTDTAAGAVVSVKVDGAFQDVVVLDGFNGSSANDLLKAGMILA